MSSFFICERYRTLALHKLNVVEFTQNYCNRFNLLHDSAYAFTKWIEINQQV